MDSSTALRGSLSGRTAIVTGALGRLGPVWSSALSQAGATVVGVDLDAADQPVPGELLYRADVTDRDSLAAVWADVEERFGPPAVLVNSAGIDQPPDAAAATVSFEEMDLDDFRRVIDVNLAGTFNASQIFGSAMVRAGGGSIVNIGSVYASVAPDPALYSHIDVDPPFLKPPAYGASKAGVVNLTRYLAKLWGPAGVRVNSLSPGGVAGGQDPEFVRRYSARTALGRLAEPDDLTGPLVFLASDASRYVTGQEIRVDGGFSI